MTKLAAAFALADRGFKVFPIKASAKHPPLLAGWPERATSDLAEIASWWAAVPDANIGVHCEGLIVIDVDAKKGGLESFVQLGEMMSLPPTLEAATPSGGRHVFYRLPEGHPGVPNSVEALAPGLDIRSARGYVVAPGSTVEAGEYRIEQDRPVAPAPEWLVLKLGTIVPKSSTPADVPDAPDTGVERAREWLAGQPPAIQGYGGDGHTYAVACGLRDQGVSAEQALTLLEEWNARCDPPWEPADLATKVQNAYKYAQNEQGGARGVVESDLPAVQNVDTSAQVPTKRHTRLLRLDEFAAEARPGPGYLVKNFLNRGSYAELFGAPGAGKTFVALDIAYHVANSKPWFGLNVHGGPVLYLAYEGIGGLKKRAKALQQKYGKDLGLLYIVGASLNLREQAGRKELGGILAEMPAPPALIVIDTFARALMGGDENSAQDVGAFNDAVARLIDATGACVLIVHHSGKNKAAGARGSSALLGALDTEIEIDNHQIIPTKQRDVELIPPIGFKLQPTVVGIDEDGEEERSCVVQPAGAIAQISKPLSGKGKHAFAILVELTGEANNPVHRTTWIQKMVEEGFAKSSAHEWVRKLHEMRRITIEDGVVLRRLE